jgi:hypothetical protein
VSIGFGKILLRRANKGIITLPRIVAMSLNRIRLGIAARLDLFVFRQTLASE